MPSVATTRRLIASPLLLLGAAEAVDAGWHVSSGSCQTDGLCITSPNYPNAYGVNEKCEIAVGPDFAGALVKDFDTEATFDTLTWDDRSHSGSMATTYDTLPEGGTIRFTTDAATNHIGWKMCPKDLAGPQWNVDPAQGNGCRKYVDGCIASVNFPRDYPVSTSCAINYPVGFKGLDIRYMDTDPLDALNFDNGRKVIAGGAPPFMFPRPGSKITWQSDSGNTDPTKKLRWKICHMTPFIADQVNKERQKGIDRAQALNPLAQPSPLDNWNFQEAAPNGRLAVPPGPSSLEVGNINAAPLSIPAAPVVPPPPKVGPGAVAPGAAAPVVPPPPKVGPGAVAPGAVAPGAVAPGAVAPGAVAPGAVAPGAYESMPSAGARESMLTGAARAAGVARSSPAIQSITSLAAAPGSAGASVAAVAAVGASVVAAAFVAAAALFKHRASRADLLTLSEGSGLVGGAPEVA